MTLTRKYVTVSVRSATKIVLTTTIGVRVGQQSYRYQSARPWLPRWRSQVTDTAEMFAVVKHCNHRIRYDNELLSRRRRSQTRRPTHYFRVRTRRFRVRCEYRTRRRWQSRVHLLNYSSHTFRFTPLARAIRVRGGELSGRRRFEIMYKTGVHSIVNVTTPSMECAKTLAR